MSPFDLPKQRAELEELKQLQQKEDFWNDVATAQKVSRQAKHIEDRLDFLAALEKDAENLSELIALTDDQNDLMEVETELKALAEKAETLHIETLLSGKYDGYDAILTLHAGAGGTEAQDWVSMLFRMYTRYAERRGYKTEVTDRLDGDEAGIKSVTFNVFGDNAYGYLKAEKGVHRLVRISPFDANKRRHTSFASLEVMPVIDNDTDIVVEDKDLKVDTYRSRSAHQQNGKRNQNHAHSHGHRCFLSDAAQSDSKPRAGDAHAQKQACRAARAGADGGGSVAQGGRQKDRVGQSNQVLRFLSVYSRQGPPHRF